MTEDKTTPIFRGNVSVVEVKSTDTNPTKLPDVEPLCAGKIDTATTRCFDLLCVGKYEQGSDLKLNVQSADRIPNLVTKNANGDPVFTQPTPACTIRAPKGHNVWVKIDLDTITTNETTATDYMCLGIKKQSEDDYFDVLHTGNKSRYVDVLDTDTVELIPLASSTPISTKYTATKPGDTAKITGENSYDFGSVFRVHVSLHGSQWLTGQQSNLGKIVSTNWFSYTKIGIGPVQDQNGVTHENQLFTINQNGTLAYSSDGHYWTKNGAITTDSIYEGCLIYGNGVWCGNTNTGKQGVRRSLNGGKDWTNPQVSIGSRNLNFSNGVFLTVDSSKNVYTSPDAEIWTQVGKVNYPDGMEVIIYGDKKYICGSYRGYIYSSKDGEGEWEQISDELHQINIADNNNSVWRGGSYVNGYFYAVRQNGLLVRSPNGINWYRVCNLPSSCYHNVTYYKNKLYIFDHSGNYSVGLFNPDGTI